MKIPFTDLRTQYESLKPSIQSRIEAVLDHGLYIMGPEVKELEDKLASFVGVKHCISASSGTDTLLIAMMALGIGPGDEVITTPFTFVSTGEMIVLLGAKPVFVDIDPHTYNIDSSLIEAAITSKTRAILPVSLFGQCSDMDSINEIAGKYGLPVIEDAAQSFGAKYKDRRSCGLSTIGSTSFFPSKPLGAYGDGGALFTDDDNLAKTMREIRVHGQDKRYHHPRVGINGRLDTIQAAVLLAKLERFEWELARRSLLGERYTKLLSQACPTITTPFVHDYNSTVYGQYSIQVENRDKIASSLAKKGIPTGTHYPIPLNEQPAYSSFCCTTCTPIASKVSKHILSLPISPDISDRTLNYVVDALAACLK